MSAGISLRFHFGAGREDWCWSRIRSSLISVAGRVGLRVRLGARQGGEPRPGKGGRKEIDAWPLPTLKLVIRAEVGRGGLC
jgi:hypothetical protein